MSLLAGVRQSWAIAICFHSAPRTHAPPRPLLPLCSSVPICFYSAPPGSAPIRLPAPLLPLSHAHLLPLCSLRPCSPHLCFQSPARLCLHSLSQSGRAGGGLRRRRSGVRVVRSRMGPLHYPGGISVGRVRLELRPHASRSSPCPHSTGMATDVADHPQRPSDTRFAYCVGWR